MGRIETLRSVVAHVIKLLQPQRKTLVAFSIQ